LNLESCSITIHPSKKFTLKLSGPSSAEYLLRGKNDEEVQMWYKHLTDCIASAQKKKEKMGKFSKEGWLEKKENRDFLF